MKATIEDICFAFENNDFVSIVWQASDNLNSNRKVLLSKGAISIC